jgi:hypothetical protein
MANRYVMYNSTQKVVLKKDVESGNIRLVHLNDVASPFVLPFENYLRMAVVRNTQLDNYNVAGENRFTIASIDTTNRRIVLNQAIPEVVKTGVAVYGCGYKWGLCKDYANAKLVEYLSGTTLTYSATKTVGTLAAGNTVTFFNPFINYAFTQLTGIAALGSAGTWNSLGMQTNGMWRGVDGVYRMIVGGTNTNGNPIRLGLMTSNDLNTWSYANGGNYMYTGGAGVFNIPGVSIANSVVYPISNPIKLADNSYLSFFTTVPSTGLAAIAPVYFDDNFIVTSVGANLIIPDYPIDYVTISGGAVMLNGVCHLYFCDRLNSTPSTWKLIEAIIPDLSTMEVTDSNIVLSNNTADVWHNLHTDAIVPFLWNNTIYLWAFGTGINTTNSIYQGNRELGLIKRNQDGSFTIDPRSPLYLNPILGNYLWDSAMSIAADHTGGGCSMWADGQDMHMFSSMNASSNTYKIFHTKILLKDQT